MIGRQVSLPGLEQYLTGVHPKRSIDRVIIHHFWKPKAADWKGLQTLKAVHHYHAVEQGWSDIGYHIVVGPDCTIWLARPMEMAGAHTIGQNETSVGIAYATDFDSEEPEENGYAAGIAACAAVMERFGLEPEAVYFHRDFASKSCPGTKMDREKFRRDLADRTALKTDQQHVRLKLDDRLVLGAGISLAEGTAEGMMGPMALALGVACRTPLERVKVREYLLTNGAAVAVNGWHPEQGPHGTIYAYTAGKQ